MRCSAACGVQAEQFGGAVSRTHGHSPEPATLLLAPLAAGVLEQGEVVNVQEGNASVLPTDSTLPCKAGL